MIGLRVKNIIIISNSKAAIILGTYSMIFNEHENLYFDDEWDIQMSSKNHEECGFGLVFDLRTILTSTCSTFTTAALIKLFWEKPKFGN